MSRDINVFDLIAQALVFVAALSLNEAAKSGIESVVGENNKKGFYGKAIYATATLVIVIGAIFILNWIAHRTDSDEDEE